MQTLIQYRYKNSNNLQTEVIGSTKNNKLVILFHQTTILYRYMKNEDRSKHVFSELLRLKQKKKEEQNCIDRCSKTHFVYTEGDFLNTNMLECNVLKITGWLVTHFISHFIQKIATFFLRFFFLN